ncbi:hypothetical protein [Gordonia iterans]
MSLVGFAADLDAVELLGTSLLFQASRSMRAEGSRRTSAGVSRTRSFRQSFLIAYALRIGERLREASTETESRVDAECGGALLPVLAARDDEVTDHAERLFPHLVSRSMQVFNADGYGAGRAAADQAQIEIRDGVSSAARE